MRCVDISGILPEVSVDPMKVVEDAVLEFTDKKDLFVAYMSSMLVGDQGMLVCIGYTQDYAFYDAVILSEKIKNTLYTKKKKISFFLHPLLF